MFIEPDHLTLEAVDLLSHADDLLMVVVHPLADMRHITLNFLQELTHKLIGNGLCHSAASYRKRIKKSRQTVTATRTAKYVAAVRLICSIWRLERFTVAFGKLAQASTFLTRTIQIGH